MRGTPGSTTIRTSSAHPRAVGPTAGLRVGLLAVLAVGLTLALVGGLASPAAAAVRRGTPGNDQIVGTARDDVIRALRGNDRVNGISGADRILGGPGRDQLYQSRPDAPVARMAGGAGDDRIVAAGVDRIFGGPGQDDLFFTAGQDGSVIDCGPGRNDVAHVDTFSRQRSDIRGCERIRRSGSRQVAPEEALLVPARAVTLLGTAAPERSCVAKPEYRAAVGGMTRGLVHRIFDTDGRRESFSDQDGLTFEVRTYRACTPAGRVAISYADRRLHGKSAVF